MEQFARIVVGYHGCAEQYARDLLVGDQPIETWSGSTNEWDWLGHGIYFWEHSPERALRRAREKFPSKGDKPRVIGAVIQLGRCFDLLNETVTARLEVTYAELVKAFAAKGEAIPQNHGRDWKLRVLDCLVINYSLEDLRKEGVEYDTVRGAFLEGDPVYPGAGFSREAHIQIAVRNRACILGVFRPNLAA